jgi:hypothetical protein
VHDGIRLEGGDCLGQELPVADVTDLCAHQTAAVAAAAAAVQSATTAAAVSVFCAWGGLNLCTRSTPPYVKLCSPAGRCACQTACPRPQAPNPDAGCFADDPVNH